MREHPIPQDITGYRFHIVGNMTIKQFAEVFVGVIIAVVFYATNLPTFIKYPLMLAGFLIGVAMAFVPFEERPLDHWFLTFFKALYRPTQFYWKKKPKIPDAFDYEPNTKTSPAELEPNLTPARRERIKEYMKSIQAEVFVDEWEEAEDERLNDVLAMFQTVQVSHTSGKQMSTKPQLKPRVRNLKAIDLNQAQLPPRNDIVSTLGQGSHTNIQQTTLPFPPTPNQANKLTGVVLNHEDQVINGAIVEIKNQAGQVARAIKTNQLGQFMTSNPLKNGSYTIEVEKDNYRFPKQSIEIAGQIIKPIAFTSEKI